MGVLGGVMVVLGLTSLVVEGIKESVSNSEKKSIAINDGRDWYIDKKGIVRYIKNDKPVIRTTIKINGEDHFVMKYAGKYEGNNVIIRDYTLEKNAETKQRSYDLAIECGMSVYAIDNNDHSHKTNEIPGRRFKDIKTGKLYVERQYGTIYFYVDINTGEVIRPSDYSILIMKWYKKYNKYQYEHHKTIKEIDAIIEKRNKNPRDNFICQSLLIYKGHDPETYFKIGWWEEYKKAYNTDKLYQNGETWDDIKLQLSDIGIIK